MWSTDVEEIVLVKGEKGLGFSILDYQVNTDPARNLFVERSSTKEFTRQNKKYWKKKIFSSTMENALAYYNAGVVNT
jgi:hypothetical protein